MGLVIEGKMLRKKLKGKKVVVTINDREVFGSKKEEKYWEPSRKVKYMPVSKLTVREKVTDRGTDAEDITYERIGWCKFDKDIEDAIDLNNRSKVKGRILLRGGDKKFWNVKKMKYERNLWIPQTPAEGLMPSGKMKMPEIPEIGAKVSYEGMDYRFEGKTGGKWKLYSNGKTRKLGYSTLYKALKNGAFYVVK